jgi:hypothetical protein
MADEWQTIETAPRDGRAILGYSNEFLDHRMTTVSWVKYESSYVPGAWYLIEAGTHAEDCDWQPTHWMALPDPPKCPAT